MTNYDQQQQLHYPFWKIKEDVVNKLYTKNSEKSFSISSPTETKTSHNKCISENQTKRTKLEWHIEINKSSVTNISECMKWRRLTFGCFNFKSRHCNSSYLNCSFLILIIIFNCIWSCLMQPTIAIG